MSEVNLKDLVISLETGKRPKGGAISTGIPSLGGEHINVDGGFNLNEDKLKYVALEYFNNMTKGKIKEKDILVVKDGATTGKVAYVDESFPLEQACINEHVFLIRVNEAVLPKYLFYYFYSPVGQRSILKDFRGATVGGISTGFIDMNIYLPPKDIQERTVKILDVAKQAIDKRKEQIEACDELIKSQFIEMFGDPVINPKGWEKHKLEEHISFLTSGSRGWSSYFSNEGELFLTIKNVKGNKIKLDNVQYVNAPDTKEAERTRVQEGDLLISITADLGRTGVVTSEIAQYGAYINQHLSLVRLNREQVNPLYVSFYLESEGGRLQFDAKNQNGVKAGLNFDAIKSLDILVPPKHLQDKFVECIQQVNKLQFEMEQSLVELENNFNSLMQRAFKGELF